MEEEEDEEEGQLPDPIKPSIQYGRCTLYVVRLYRGFD